jgi:hypothetical protein
MGVTDIPSYVPKAMLNTLKVRYLDIRQRDNKKREFRQIDQTVCCRLEQDKLAMRHAIEPEFPEWNVHVESSVRLGHITSMLAYCPSSPNELHISPHPISCRRSS